MIRPYLLDIVYELQSRPQMYMPRPSYSAICAYIMGYDHCLAATGNSSVGLDGFREWIVVKNHGDFKPHWSDLVPNHCQNPESPTDEDKCETLFSLIEEFWANRETRGIQAITDDFSKVIGSEP